MNRHSLFLLSLGGFGASLLAQVPDGPSSPAPAAVSPTSASAPAPAPAAAESKPAGNGMLGGDAPMFNPGNEVLSWDGKNWNINNNRVFEARFEKYLNAPEETTQEDRQYQAILQEILNRLAPGYATSANIDYAFRLLARASNYDIDAHLCDTLADAVYTVWSAQRQQQRLFAANNALQYEVVSLEASTRHQGAVTQHVEATRANSSGAKNNSKTPGAPAPSTQSDSTTAGAAEAKQTELETNNWQTRRLAEMVTRQKANDAKRELSEIQAKVEFQAIILQFFLQRRFQHVLMATRFYRSIFSDGDSKLNVDNGTKELFTRAAGMPPTVSTLDSMANEALRDVREGVKAFEFLLQSNEMQSATKRLAEAFTVGEYVPEIRTLPREKKRQALEFSQKSYQLLSAIDVKDYSLAEKLVKDLTTIAHDFDASKPNAAIESARTIAGFKLLDARNAAARGDRETLEKDLREATEIWPRNPALAEISQKIFDGGNVQQTALTDFDQLMRQKSFRQISEDQGRFIAATALYPDRQTQLKDVLERVGKVNAAIEAAKSMGDQKDYAGAWELLEHVSDQLPDDPKLNSARNLVMKGALDFVSMLSDAQEMEKREQLGSSLALYLKAQKVYPASSFAKDGVDRLTKRILPAE